MRRSRERPHRFRIALASFALCAAIVLLLVGNAKQWYRRNEQQRMTQELRDEIARLDREEQSTRDLLENLDSPFFIEKVARAQFGLRKEGETAVLFPSADAPAPSAGHPDASSDAPSHPRAWFQYFFSPKK